jgi:hypothetical protein
MIARKSLGLPSGMKKFAWLCAAILACLGGCMDTPENGTTVDENATIRFSGYAPSGGIELQVETESGWQAIATTHTQDQWRTVAFDDQQYDLFPWTIDTVVPGAGWRQIQGRDGTRFRGARLRMLAGGAEAYTVKPGALSCWEANRSTLQRWIDSCTPATDNKMLELRSSFQLPVIPPERPEKGCPAGTHKDCQYEIDIGAVVCECAASLCQEWQRAIEGVGCVACGGNGQPWCQRAYSGAYCQDGLTPAGDICVPCGADGQPACGGSRCNNPGSGPLPGAAGLLTCTPCGTPELPVCPSGMLACRGGFELEEVADGVLKCATSWGRPGQRCGGRFTEVCRDNDHFCLEGRCHAACGSEGEACCPSGPPQGCFNGVPCTNGACKRPRPVDECTNPNPCGLGGQSACYCSAEKCLEGQHHGNGCYTCGYPGLPACAGHPCYEGQPVNGYCQRP